MRTQRALLICSEQWSEQEGRVIKDGVIYSCCHWGVLLGSIGETKLKKKNPQRFILTHNSGTLSSRLERLNTFDWGAGC